MCDLCLGWVWQSWGGGGTYFGGESSTLKGGTVFKYNGAFNIWWVASSVTIPIECHRHFPYIPNTLLLFSSITVKMNEEVIILSLRPKACKHQLRSPCITKDL